jgi:predicted DNA-binding transcriptional regulator AlpA
MTRPRPRWEIEPRIVNARDVAFRLGKSEGWFHAHYEQLQNKDFPPRDELLGGWDLHAVDQWIDTRSGLRPEPRSPSERRRSLEAELIARAQNGASHS